MADGKYWLSHDAQDIDDTIDEVVAARGSEASLSARLADIVSDFEADQQRQDDAITGKANAADVVSHELVVASGSITDYADTLSAGFYTARQGYATGTDKPASNEGFAYLIFIFSATTAQITAFTAVKQGGGTVPNIYTRTKSSSGWGSWYKFEGSQLAAASLSAPASLMQAGRLDAELTDTGTGEEEEER